MRPRYLAQHAKDLAEPAIRDALNEAGFHVFDRLPVDLLTWRADKGFQLLEIKTPTPAGQRPKRTDQQAQQAFLALTGVAVVMDAESALKAVGAT